MLLLNFGMAKLDNDTRARHIKSRMQVCTQNWQCLYRAPFGYKNITILHDWKMVSKSVDIVPMEAQIVEEIFHLRVHSGMSIPDISSYCREKYSQEKYQFSVAGIGKLLKNPFYIWVIKYNWEYIPWIHKSIISTKIFQKARDMERSFCSHEKESNQNFIYKGRIFDAEEWSRTTLPKCSLCTSFEQGGRWFRDTHLCHPTHARRNQSQWLPFRRILPLWWLQCIGLGWMAPRAPIHWTRRGGRSCSMIQLLSLWRRFFPSRPRGRRRIGERNRFFRSQMVQRFRREPWHAFFVL